MTERFSIAGRRALITGASQGIGRMIAAGYVDAGATVYACSRNEEACRTLEKELSTQGRCIALPGDVSTEAGCRAIADALHGYEDRLDILVNNAGAAAMAPIDSFGDDVWDEVLAVNLKGPFYLVRFLLPLLRAASGPDSPARVINIGSISALRMQDMDNYAYTASKAALHTLTRQLARRLAPSVTVNAIVPGPFPSLMMADVLEKYGEAMAAASPMKRIGREDDIAGAAIFLASPAAAWMTGTTMILDGGLSTT
jgi:NAD(P)-dependent dehydrogenase (short-subunit alcohol dehydrogenase family)